MQRPLILIFMGVSGCGKTTIARLFAEKTGARFYEGDAYHPPTNIAKMRAGEPLTDEDREPWLNALRKIIVHSIENNELAVMTCSALKAKYREYLKQGDLRVIFVHLSGSFDLIQKRLEQRAGHFMPPKLLTSQFAALEPPTDALVVDINKSPEEIVNELIQTISR